MSDPIHTLQTGEFKAVMEFSPDSKELTNVLTGTADYQILAELKDYLKRVNEQATLLGATASSFDLRGVKFMNSSCLKNFVWFLTVVNAIPADKRYRVIFLTSESSHWQKNSLAALACIGEDNMSIIRS